MIAVIGQEFTIGSTSIRKTGPRKWDLILKMDIDPETTPVEIFQFQVCKKAEAVVRYMRTEQLIDEGKQTFNINVS